MPEPDTSMTSLRKPPSRRLRLAVRLSVLAAAVLLSAGLGEVFCRTLLGLGDPPLYVADPEIEYMLAPGQDVRRFGNRILVNRWGMRSPPFDKHKTAADEVRVLVFGDSVVNGGNQTDHEQLATSLLAKRLSAAWGRPVTVGNVSAGSWGPGNWRAYLNRYGSFDADVVLLVVNSGDAYDNPTFEPLQPATHPTRKPRLALEEGFSRYLPRYLTAGRDPASGPADQVPPSQAEYRRALQDLRDFLAGLKTAGATVLVLHHPDAAEMDAGKDQPGHDRMLALCRELGVPFDSMRGDYAVAGAASLYRDSIHPNARGQQIMAEAMFRATTRLRP